jgi:hypothetical protein
VELQQDISLKRNIIPAFNVKPLCGLIKGTSFPVKYNGIFDGRKFFAPDVVYTVIIPSYWIQGKNPQSGECSQGEIQNFYFAVKSFMTYFPIPAILIENRKSLVSFDNLVVAG